MRELKKNLSWKRVFGFPDYEISVYRGLGVVRKSPNVKNWVHKGPGEIIAQDSTRGNSVTLHYNGMKARCPIKDLVSQNFQTIVRDRVTLV